MLRWQTVGVAYALLGTLASALAVALRNGSPFTHPDPWLVLEEPLRTGASCLLAIALSIVLIISTRMAVQRWQWAQRLHADLRPVARDLSVTSVVMVAVLSSLGEELFFRGFLTPLVGVVAQAALFGLVHQVNGPSRWVWVAWASAVGLLLGALFALTGSLLGTLITHALVNGYNLMFLRSHDPSPRERRLGGLLASSDV